jgi:hypothetical protein
MRGRGVRFIGKAEFEMGFEDLNWCCVGGYLVALEPAVLLVDGHRDANARLEGSRGGNAVRMWKGG